MPATAPKRARARSVFFIIRIFLISRVVVLSPRPISKIVCTPDLRAGRREKTVFHCGVVRAEPPRSSRDIPRRLRSVRRFGAVGSEGRRAQVDRRIGKSAPRATCRGSVEEPRASSAHFVSETPQHPSLKTTMGSSRIKNPHHTGGIIPSLCLETRFPSEFQAKKRCENATRAFAFAKRSEFPTYLPYEVVDRRRRRVLAIFRGISRPI